MAGAIGAVVAEKSAGESRASRASKDGGHVADSMAVGTQSNLVHGRAERVEWAQVDKSKYFGKGALLLAASQLLLHPLDVFKTRIQMLGNGSKRGTMSSTGVLTDLYRAEGISGLFRGFGPAMLGVLAGQVYMMSLETAKAALAAHRPSAQGQTQQKGMHAAVAGMVAACMKEVISTPANIISLRMQTHGMELASNGAAAGTTAAAGGGAASISTGGGYRPSMGAVAMDLVRTDGFFGGLYRGFWLQLFTSLPTHALFWASHRTLSDQLTKCWLELPLCMPQAKPLNIGNAGVGSLDAAIGATSVVPTLGISGVSAFLGATFAIVCTTPIDVIKTHIQVEGKEGGGVRRTIQRLLNNGGVVSLWKGLAPRCLKYAPLASAVVVYFEHAKQTSAIAAGSGGACRPSY
jgi:hypothetical protein